LASNSRASPGSAASPAAAQPPAPAGVPGLARAVEQPASTTSGTPRSGTIASRTNRPASTSSARPSAASRTESATFSQPYRLYSARLTHKVQQEYCWRVRSSS
jgi:hypothetical protein